MNEKQIAFLFIGVLTLIFGNTLPKFFPGEDFILRRLIIKVGILIFFIGSFIYIAVK
jgi:hypothetical protein